MSEDGCDAIKAFLVKNGISVKSVRFQNFVYVIRTNEPIEPGKLEQLGFYVESNWLYTAWVLPTLENSESINNP